MRKQIIFQLNKKSLTLRQLSRNACSDNKFLEYSGAHACNQILRLCWDCWVSILSSQHLLSFGQGSIVARLEMLKRYRSEEASKKQNAKNQMLKKCKHDLYIHIKKKPKGEK